MRQFKNNINKCSNKLNLDKYYTPVDLAKYCIDKTFEVIGKENITHIIEPSAGNGSFSSQLDCDAYDIEPEGDGIIKQDYLTLDLEYKKGRLIIGNPPYGARNSLSVKFFKKSIKACDYIAFIQPISQLNKSQQMYEFDLIHSEDIGVQTYSGRDVHCCYNIYGRPRGNELNKKPRYVFNDIKLVQDRGMCGYKDEKYSFRICIWGANTGKKLEKNEKYAKETAIYIYNDNFTERIESLFSKEKIKEEFKFTSTPYLPNSMIYEYILKHIPEIN